MNTKVTNIFERTLLPAMPSKKLEFKNLEIHNQMILMSEESAIMFYTLDLYRELPEELHDTVNKIHLQRMKALEQNYYHKAEVRAEEIDQPFEVLPEEFKTADELQESNSQTK